MVLVRSVSTSSLGSSRSETPSLASSLSSYKSRTGYGVDPELENIAEALEKRLKGEGKVKERSTTLLNKKIPKAFVGSEAVTILQEIMEEKRVRDAAIALKLPKGSDSEEDDDEEEEDKAAKPVSREDALETGRRIATEFGLFKHATTIMDLGNLNGGGGGEIPLNDTKTDYYQFHNNLPKHVAAMKKQHKTYWDKMRLMEEHVEIKDRWYFPRVYPDCFVAKEAVDTLMELKLVRSRGEAVHLVRRLNQKVFCCQHVTSEHEFKDEYLFFKFVPKHERMPEPPPRPSSSKSRSPSRKRDKLAKTRKDSQKKIREKRCRSMSHVNQDLLDNNDNTAAPAPPNHHHNLYNLDKGSNQSMINLHDHSSSTHTTASASNAGGNDASGSGSNWQQSAPSLLGALDHSVLDLDLDEPDDLLLNLTTGTASTTHSAPTATNTSSSNMPKAKSTGTLPLSLHHKRANRKRANDIRARLANFHQERIQSNTNNNNQKKKTTTIDPAKRASLLAEGRRSLEKAKTELIMEAMPLPYHLNSQQPQPQPQPQQPQQQKPQQSLLVNNTLSVGAAATTAQPQQERSIQAGEEKEEVGDEDHVVATPPDKTHPIRAASVSIDC